MNDDPRFKNSFDPNAQRNDSSPRSPIRPSAPAQPEPSRRPTTPTSAPTPDAGASDPHQALSNLRRKMETVATEFSEGRINRAQFNAMYGRYSEQRTIIERLVERNPDSKAWKQVMGSGGHTNFLREHFESQALFFMVYRHHAPSPLMIGGKTKPDMAQMTPILRALWAMPKRPKIGLARKALGDELWVVLALGEYAVTLVMFLMEPSLAQATLVRDMHTDFERANHAALKRGTAQLERMVFPQRALVEEKGF